MSAREPELIVNTEEFPLFLKMRMGTSTIAEFAAATGISRQLIYPMLAGERAPSKDVLKKLNLKIAYVVDRSAAPATPAKARAKKKE